MSTDNNFVQKFIAEIKQRRTLWDNRHPTYHDKYELYCGWREVSETFGISVAVAKQKWKLLRDTFCNEVKKEMGLQTAEELPEGVVREPNCQSMWQHYDDMLFIKEILKKYRQDHVTTDNEKIFKEEEEEEEESSNAIIDTDNKDGIQIQHSGMPLSELNSRLSQDGSDDDPLRNRGKAFEVGANGNKRRKLDYEMEHDEDLFFFKSLIPYVQRLPDDKRLLFRTSVQQILHNELYENK